MNCQNKPNIYFSNVIKESINRIEHAKKALENKRDGVNQKRIKIEKDYFANKLSADQLQKFNIQLDAEALAIQKELAEQDKVSTIDTKVVNEVLELTRNIVQTYEKSDTDHQRAYLHFFFQKIWVQDKKIVEAEHTLALQVLNEAKTVRITPTLLENRSTNITQELSRIFKAFSDFRLVAQIREEIEKVNQINTLALYTLPVSK